MNFIRSKLGWKGNYSHVCLLCFANQWIVQDIPSFSSQSERAKNTIHWFGIKQNIPNLGSQSERVKWIFADLVFTN